MKTATLLIEFLIIGFLAAIVIFLCYTLCYIVNFDTLLKFLGKSSEFAAIVFTVTIYTLGAITHRGVEIFCAHVIFRKDDNKDKTKMLTVLQKGSENVNNRIIYELSLMRIFASISFLMPFVGVLYLAVDCKYEDVNSGIFVFLLSCSIMVVSILCYIPQKNSVKQIMDNFTEMMESQ